VTSAFTSTIWHKPLSEYEGRRLIANDVDPRLGGLPDVVNGSITPATHIAHLRGAASYYEALGLNYAGSLFAPDSPLFSWRFTLAHATRIQATDGPLARSIGKSDGADLGYAMPPYTGNGFTAPGYAIPEYWIIGGILAGGELWHIPVHGEETLAAVLTGTNEWSAVRSQRDA
jgi:hypothetical protein